MNHINPTLSGAAPFAALEKLFRPQSKRRTTPDNLLERLASIRENHDTATSAVDGYHKSVQEGRKKAAEMMALVEAESIKANEMKYLPDALLAAELAAAERAATIQASELTIARVMALASEVMPHERCCDAVAPLRQLLSALSKVQNLTTEN